jgi:RNA polymerase sigma factor (TIGR02999 family)
MRGMSWSAGACLAVGNELSLASLVQAADSGDSAAAGTLFASLYAELHRLAQRQLRGQAGPLTLHTTTLLHEAYLDMAGKDAAAFPDKARFMGYAARVMRGLIVDFARQRQALKRGGGVAITVLEGDAADPPDGAELAELSGALDKLAEVEPELAQVVDLKFFCGFSFEEIGAMRDVSERTVQRQWAKARMYLHRALRPDPET